MHDIHYQVDGKNFYNNYLAYYESYKSGKPVTFNVNESEFDVLDWTKNPNESMDQIMANHAHFLRQKYDVLILHWSGGTDSHTIYNIFKQEKIHIDEIKVITGNERTPKFPTLFYDWLCKNHWDPTTKLTTIDVLDPNSKQSVMTDDNWMFNNVAFMPVFSYSSFEPADIQTNNELYGGKSWAIISGHEKPDIVHLNGNWFTRFEDRVMRQSMNPYVENFFTAPLVHLKQSHLLKNAVKLKSSAFENGQRAIDFYNMNNKNQRAIDQDDYHNHATACGRHTELLYGHSSLQKKVTKFQLTEINLDMVGGKLELHSEIPDQLLMEKIKDRHPMAMRYLNGINALTHEKPFMEFLNNTRLGMANNPLGVKPIFSKPYNIGS
jgi:hypothetical protein